MKIDTQVIHDYGDILLKAIKKGGSKDNFSGVAYVSGSSFVFHIVSDSYIIELYCPIIETEKDKVYTLIIPPQKIRELLKKKPKFIIVSRTVDGYILVSKGLVIYTGHVKKDSPRKLEPVECTKTDENTLKRLKNLKSNRIVTIEDGKVVITPSKDRRLAVNRLVVELIKKEVPLEQICKCDGHTMFQFANGIRIYIKSETPNKVPKNINVSESS